MDLDQLEKFVMDSLETGFNNGFFETEDGMNAVQKIIVDRFSLYRKGKQ